MGWSVVERMREQVSDVHLLVPERGQRPEIVTETRNPGELAILMRQVELFDRQKFTGELIVAVGRTPGDVVKIAEHPRQDVFERQVENSQCDRRGRVVV